MLRWLRRLQSARARPTEAIRPSFRQWDSSGRYDDSCPFIALRVNVKRDDGATEADPSAPACSELPARQGRTSLG